VLDSVTSILRVFVGLLSAAALVPIVIGFVFLARMAHAFGYHRTDGPLFAGMLLAIAYFAAALVTCFPQFPASALGRFGAVLHFLIMPGAVALVCIALGVKGALYLLPGAVFAAIWFCMARSIYPHHPMSHLPKAAPQPNQALERTDSAE
jgi:hypothetical protein